MIVGECDEASGISETIAWNGRCCRIVVARRVRRRRLKEIRIGYQKTGVLVIARQQAMLEKHFAAGRSAIKWVEFTSGPPLLEAMNTGSVDFGSVGDTPPMFAQAANASISSMSRDQPITNGQGILVPESSPIRTIADLKGKRVGFTKGSSAHNVVDRGRSKRPG